MSRNSVGTSECHSVECGHSLDYGLQHHYPGIQLQSDGIPRDYESACALSQKDKLRFQNWAISLLDAHAPSGVTKQGADRGIDGIILFYERPEFQKLTTTLRKILVQVKADQKHLFSLQAG